MSRVVARPLVGVLAVQGAVSEHEAALRSVGAEPRQVRRAEELIGLDALVIPGGESTTFGLVAGESGLLQGVRAAVGGGLPVLGTCAGLIMLARGTTGGGSNGAGRDARPAQPLVGGMDIVARRNAFGRQRASFEADLAVPALGAEPVHGVFIRAPWIERAGPGVQVLATHRGHGVAARQGSMMVTAFHPELAGEPRFHAWLAERARAWRAEPSEREEGARVRA